MSEAKHTPGPWFVSDQGTVYFRLPNGSEPPICRTTGIDLQELDLDQSIVNAHLLAAAPDLLAALEAMLDVQSRRRHPLGQPDEGIAYAAADAASKARAAIAKAGGK